MTPSDNEPPLPDWLMGETSGSSSVDMGLPMPPDPFSSLSPPEPEFPPVASESTSEGIIETPPPVRQTRTPTPVAPVVVQRVPPESDGWVRSTVPVVADMAPNGSAVRLRLSVRGLAPAGSAVCQVRTKRIPGIRSIRATIKPKVEGDHFAWDLGSLKAGQEVSITLMLPTNDKAKDLLGKSWSFEVAHQALPAAVPVPAAEAMEPPPPSELLAPLLAQPTIDASHESMEDLLAPAIPAAPVVPSAPTIEPAKAAIVTLTAHAAETCLLDASVKLRIRLANSGQASARGLTIECEASDEFVHENPNDTQTRWEIDELEANQEWTAAPGWRATVPGTGRLKVTVRDGTGIIAVEDLEVACRIGAGVSNSINELLSSFSTSESLVSAATEMVDRKADLRTGERHILFTLGGVGHSVPIGSVREVVRPPAVTPAPGSPSWLVGVANVRGDIATVIDLPKFLSLETGVDRRALLVVPAGDDVVGLLVDDVAGIRRLAPGPIDPAVRDCDQRVTPFLSGIAEHGGRLVQVLDLALVVAATEAETAA